MSLDTPTDTNSSFGSDFFSEISLYHLEDEPLRPKTPLPTVDSIDHMDWELTSPLGSEMSLLLLTPPPETSERPVTSTSSIFSFVTETLRTPPPAESLRLPTFIAPENPGFFESVATSEGNLYKRFNEWLDDCKPRGGSFATESAEELTKNPRDTRSEPELPSLFKKREHGCGYCKSVGYSRWETHTRTKCVQLRALAPCKICGAHGEMNHTETYCPMKPPVNLTLTKRFARSSESRRFQRSSNHFHKYSTLIHRIFSSSDLSF